MVLLFLEAPFRTNHRHVSIAILSLAYSRRTILCVYFKPNTNINSLRFEHRRFSCGKKEIIYYHSQCFPHIHTHTVVMSPPRDHILLNLVIYCDIQLPNDNRMLFNGISSFVSLMRIAFSRLHTNLDATTPPLPSSQFQLNARHQWERGTKKKACNFLFSCCWFGKILQHTCWKWIEWEISRIPSRVSWKLAPCVHVAFISFNHILNTPLKALARLMFLMCRDLWCAPSMPFCLFRRVLLSNEISISVLDSQHGGFR